MGRVASAVWLAVLLGGGPAAGAGDAPVVDAAGLAAGAAPSVKGLGPADGRATTAVSAVVAASSNVRPASASVPGAGGATTAGSAEVAVSSEERPASASVGAAPHEPSDGRATSAVDDGVSRGSSDGGGTADSAAAQVAAGDGGVSAGSSADQASEDGRPASPADDGGDEARAASAGARPTAGALLANRPGRGLLTHDEYRFGQRWNLVVGLLLRPFMDLVAIPSGVVAWNARDWGTLAAVAGVVAGLSLPLGPSPDVFIQRKLQASLGGADHFRVWTKYGDFTIWATLYGALASTFLYGLVEGQPAFIEAPALALEAFLVMQVYHWGLKMLTGRDGPDRNVAPGELTSDGSYRGPAGFMDPYGSGTPSGHVASVYALFSVLMHYFDTPALWIGLHVAGALFALTIIADNYHFASEVILGAVMGYCVGRWVVEHRSSRYRNDDGGLPRRVWNTVKEHTSLAPAVLPGGGVGASVMVRWD